MTREEEVAQLRAEIQTLREAVSRALDQLSQAQEQLRVALERVGELEKQKTQPPAFVKATVAKPRAEEKHPRKKRESKHNHGRRRSGPTQITEHRMLICPACRLRLGVAKPATRLR